MDKRTKPETKDKPAASAGKPAKAHKTQSGELSEADLTKIAGGTGTHGAGGGGGAGKVTG